MENAGEAQERNYRRRQLLILGVATVLAFLAPFVLVAIGDANVVFPDTTTSDWHLSLGARIAIAVVFFGALGLVGRWSWVASDEVRRSHILTFWAAIGVSVSITFFGFMLFGSEIPEPERLKLAFLLPIVMGTLFGVARWLRDGYVP
jgi:hypothetical protein